MELLQLMYFMFSNGMYISMSEERIELSMSSIMPVTVNVVGFTYGMFRTEQAEGGGAGKYDTVVICKQLFTVPFYQRETEELEKVLFYYTALCLHRFITYFYEQFRYTYGTPVLYLRIAALQAVAQVVMSSRICRVTMLAIRSTNISEMLSPATLTNVKSLLRSKKVK